MLLGKKKQGEEQNWCVVLNPLPNEIDKKKVARKISDVFSLSMEEALDLVSNTPIILLDSLAKSTATRLKEYFQSAGAEMILTNDVFLKRKCYRTVWPEPPNLSFVEAFFDGREKKKAEETKMDAHEALEEIRSLQGGEEAELETSSQPTEKMREGDRQQLLDELMKWREECMSRRSEIERLRSELDQIQQDNAQAGEPQDMQQALEQRESELKELRALLANAEERFEGLTEEYRQARHLFEERMSAPIEESEEDKQVRYEQERQLRALETERDELRARLVEAEARVVELSATDNAPTEDVSAKLVEAERSAESAAFRVRELEQRVQFLENTNTVLQEKTDELERESGALKQSSAIQSEELENQLRESTAELATWKSRAEDLFAKIEVAETGRGEAEKSLDEHRGLLSEWREKHDTLYEQHQVLLSDFEEEKAQRGRSEEKLREIESGQTRLVEELDAKSRKVNQLELRVFDLERSMNELRVTAEERDRAFGESQRLLENRERELDHMRRQVREMTTQAEQREAAQRRIQLVNQLGEKENLFKTLVKQQQKIESEIRDREESMREVLADQEKLEREIIEAKQAQRHILEQAKKDRGPRIRIHRGDRPVGEPFSEAAPEDQADDRTDSEQD